MIRPLLWPVRSAGMCGHICYRSKRVLMYRRVLQKESAIKFKDDAQISGEYSLNRCRLQMRIALEKQIIEVKKADMAGGDLFS
jgi:hypothetical protein